MNSVRFLEEAYEALKTLEEEKMNQQELQTNLKKAEKELEVTKRSMNDEINATTKEKYDGIAAEYDSQISSLQNKLKKLRQHKDSTKKSKKEDRIQEQTAPLLTKEDQLKNKLKQIFDNNRVPQICRSRVFYLLFMPTNVLAWIIDLLLITLFFLGIPYGIAALIPQKNILLSALISFGCVIVFGGLYLLLDHTLKENHLQALKDGKKLINSIDANRKAIKKLTRSIQKDDKEENDEEIKQHNYEIAKQEAELEEITTQKKEALDKFNAATKKVIQNEISSRYEDALTQQQSLVTNYSEQLTQSQTSEADLRRIISEKYEPYLEKEFLSSEKVNVLISMLNSGEGANITEAISLYRKSK